MHRKSFGSGQNEEFSLPSAFRNDLKTFAQIFKKKRNHKQPISQTTKQLNNQTSTAFRDARD
jgi:hypothetical protein